MRIQVKKKKVLLLPTLAVLVAFVCFFGVGFSSRDDSNDHSETDVTDSMVGSYEDFSGTVYDESRLEPVDMCALLEQWNGKTGTDLSLKKDFGTNHDSGFRYYVDEERYLLGWQYLEQDGIWDWYYFAEDTGYMVTDTILDGVVLDENGYAVAVTAATEETLQSLDTAAHCKEVLLNNTIETTEQINVSKDLLVVGIQGENYCIEFNGNGSNLLEEDIDAADTYSVTERSTELGVMQVFNQAVLTIADNVEIATNGTCQDGIVLKDGATLHCYGNVGDSVMQQANCAIAALDSDTNVYLYPKAEISGAEVGIYSMGNTVLVGLEESELPNIVESQSEDKNQQEVGQLKAIGSLRDRFVSIFSAFSVQAETVSSGQKITGNTGNGIVQNGGTLTMSGGEIYNNGTLGDSNVLGSFGGGVCLKNGAVMNMTGGTISSNCATYGGGIYVDSGCTLNLYGGTIGGSTEYNPTGSNTVNSGNYARESKCDQTSMLYGYGGGGGICSLGKINVVGNAPVNIAYNCSKGSIGGAGVLAVDGYAYFSGTVTVHHNHAYNSAGTSSAHIMGKDDIYGEGGGIRLGTEESGVDIICTINCENQEEFPELEGTVVIQNNVSGGDGGGIFMSSGTNHQLVVKGDTSICGNTAQNQGGGGVKTNGGSIYLYGTNIYSNTAAGSIGGGVAGAGVVDLETCNIYSNSAGTSGGGVAIFTSAEGVTGNGYVYGCQVYDNTSGAGGSGIDVQGDATVNVMGDTQVYGNKDGKAAVHCNSESTLLLNLCDIYGNKNYGVANYGTTTVSSTSTLGFSSYSSTSKYTLNQNEKGGCYNAGSLTVAKGTPFYVYGGSCAALENAGGAVTFEKSSSNRFYGKNGQSVIWNQGAITATESGLLSSALVMVAGDNVEYGIDNDGGILNWSSNIIGNYQIADTKMTKTSSADGIKCGLYNHNSGEVFLTGGVCCDCREYGVYCETGSELHMSEKATVDSSNKVFLEKDCYIDINGALSSTSAIALLDTKENSDRKAGRIMAKVSYSGGTGADELYDADGNKRFLLAYDTVDSGTEAFLLDGSDIRGVSDTVAANISEADIYLSTVEVDVPEVLESQLEAWLYDRSAWLRNQMSGDKGDEIYQTFTPGDTGVITFSCVNLTEVSILWPSTGAEDELRTYDTLGTEVLERSYDITELAEDYTLLYENSSYQFQVPAGTPDGIYYVTVWGINDRGEEFTCVLPVLVGQENIATSFRTRIR